MQVRVQEDKSKFGTCGCGRSPTGNCIGWHGLPKAIYEQKLKEYQDKVALNEYQKQAQTLWSDSCTTPRGE
jgi:hypothetical protein